MKMENHNIATLLKINLKFYYICKARLRVELYIFGVKISQNTNVMEHLLPFNLIPYFIQLDHILKNVFGSHFN